jgi:GNAT superfamily N-acetyltransferase
MDVTTSLRAATPDDAALILRITRESWTGRVDPASSAFRETEEQIAAQLADGGGLVLYVDRVAAGSVRHSPVTGDANVSPHGAAWEVRRMGVLPQFRGRGYALALMNAVISRALASGICDLRLAVRADQPRLIDVYACMGFALAPEIEYAHASPGSSPPTVMRRLLSA